MLIQLLGCPFPSHQGGPMLMHPRNPRRDAPEACNTQHEGVLFSNKLLQLAFSDQEALQSSAWWQICCQHPAHQQVSCSTSRNCSPTESQGRRALRQASQATAQNEDLGQAAQTTQSHERVFKPGNFLSCIPSRLAFVKINPTLL